MRVLALCMLQAIRAAFSFGQLIEVLSMGSQNRLSLRFLSVLGTGGQGIVLLVSSLVV